jgi:sulfur-oxidizing protein SoxA
MKKTILTTALIAISSLAANASFAEEASVDAYRAQLADKDSNPGLMVIDDGEKYFKEKSGPKNASLEKCDFGLGAGKLKGAYAQMPRYFKDTDRVEDVESRIVTCMVDLQGKNRAEIIDRKKTFADQRKHEDNTKLEAIAAYVAYQSDGMPLKPSTSHAKEKEAIAFGEGLFWRRHGSMDFSCASCHAADGQRVRLQPLVNAYNTKDIQATMTTWPTYRVSHNLVRNNQHRMWDCNWQMRLPDIEYGSDGAIALIAFLTKQAEDGKLNVPGMKR